MTVAELIEALKAFNPELPVLVECEHRCDPHPVTSTYGGSKAVRLWQNQNVDINPNTGKPRSEDPVDEDDDEPLD